MMFPINYLVYSVKYLVCLLLTTRTNQVGEYNITHSGQPHLSSSSALGVRWLLTINSRLYLLHNYTSH